MADTTMDLFHGLGGVAATNSVVTLDTEFTYTFENFYHPFVGELIEKLDRESLPGMLDPGFHESLSKHAENPPPSDTLFAYFEDFYQKPPKGTLVEAEGFPEEIDLREGGPYANYNWELFFHIPLTVAVHLSKNQRFAEAQRWFHYVFNPLCNDASPAPQRFWRFLGFRKTNDVTQIDELLALLSKSSLTAAEAKTRDAILNGYEAIKNRPFQPHAVARTRHLAYQYFVVMKYLDNLIAWGDSLFRQDTVESINEATQRYILAANLLGPRPQRIPPRGTTRSRTFAELKKLWEDPTKKDPMGNALVDLEGQFPFNLGVPSTQGTMPGARQPLFGIGRTLYFCIPRNEKMLGYWDTAADRLFKIRNCMNLEGVVRQLALFDPPLDPGMLVKASAAGIDISSMAGGLNQPIGPTRCLFLFQKALELCSEVRGLGAALLSAIEKGDSERIALLRQSHEVKIQQLAQDARFLQWKQAEAATESLLQSRASALERYGYYQRLLGLTPDSTTAPDTLPLDRRELTEETFDSAYAALVGQYDKAIASVDHPRLTLADSESPLNAADLLSEGQLYLNQKEFLALNVLPAGSAVLRMTAAGADVITAILSVLPYAKVEVKPLGIGVGVEVAVGQVISNIGQALSRSIGTLAGLIDTAASFVSQTASYERRADDWILQNNLAARELMQMGRQILGSLIAEQIARREYLNVQKQIDQSREIDLLMREKFSNEQLYGWLQGEMSRLYYEYYRFAFDTARRAEQTMRRELMRPEVDVTEYTKFNYWDSGRRGLLSGEALYLDIKRMEMAYHEHNRREYELTKHVSLRQLDPVALLRLKSAGACEVTLPEWLFDLDAPGHYLRRFKQVSLSIPSVTGPYTNVSCTLTLLRSSIRKTPQLEEDQYGRTGSEDSRFIDYVGTVQSIVTSTGSNDAGLFETNLRDERFLPFEGAGAESAWKLELPDSFRQFDYNTISDVILHLRYTAREGGQNLRNKAVEHVQALVGEATASGLALLLGLKHDFPSEWHRYVAGTGKFTATVKREHFPYFTKGKAVTIEAVQLYTITDSAVNQPTTPTGVSPGALTTALESGDAFDLVLSPDKTAQVFVLIRYSLEQ